MIDNYGLWAVRLDEVHLGNQSVINTILENYAIFDNTDNNLQLSSLAWDGYFRPMVEASSEGWNCGGGGSCTNDLGTCT